MKTVVVETFGEEYPEPDSVFSAVSWAEEAETEGAVPSLAVSPIV